MTLVVISLSLLACDSGPDTKKPESTEERKERLAMQDQEIDVFEVSDRVFDRYSRSGYATLSKPEQVFVCVWGLDGEVNNGGFDQYFFNSAGDHALDSPNALLAIRAHVTAKIVQEANALWIPGRTSDLHIFALPSCFDHDGCLTLRGSHDQASQERASYNCQEERKARCL